MTAEVILYTRNQCGLCEETAAELHRLRDELRFTVRELDIDQDETLRAAYTDIVPVVAVGERVIAHAPVDPVALRRALIEELRG